MEMKSRTFASCHCWVVHALCAGAESCWELQFCPWKRVLQEESIESLKRSVWRAVADFLVDLLHNSIVEWPQRLKDCARANGGHFE